MNNLQPTFAEFQAFQPAYADMASESYADVVQDATAWVDAYIFPNSVTSESDADVITAYKQAICAVIATEKAYPELHVKAYTTGKVHEELDGSGYQMIATAAAPYLSGSGLLCRWL